MMPEPIYTYAALGFIVGLGVGISFCHGLVALAQRRVRQANRALSHAHTSLSRAIALNELTQSALRDIRSAGKE